jgi:hypothetical protein
MFSDPVSKSIAERDAEDKAAKRAERDYRERMTKQEQEEERKKRRREEERERTRER